VETRRPYKSFRYKANTAWSSARRGPLSASGKPNIVVGSPPEFKGEPGWGLRLGASSLRSSVKRPAEWAGNTIPVQIGRDGTRRFSSRKFPEDAADDRGVRFIDLAFAPNRLALTVGPLHHLLAIAEPTARLTLLHPPTQASMGLGGEASCLCKRRFSPGRGARLRNGSQVGSPRLMKPRRPMPEKAPPGVGPRHQMLDSNLSPCASRYGDLPEV
jgi:hypothetical protein